MWITKHSNNTDVILVDNIMKKIYFLDKRHFELRSAIETQYIVQSINYDYVTGNIYFAYSHIVVEMDTISLENSTINMQGYDIKHMCVIATSIIFTSEEDDHSSLFSYNKSTGNITTIANDLREPGDILCDYNSGFVFISERRLTYSIRKIHVAENSTNHIQIGNKQGEYRLSAYRTDKVFYCLDIDTSVIYDVTFEGKSGYFFSTSKYKLIDFDVDQKFVYGILRQQRFILKINRSDTTLTEIVSVSPLFGVLQFIVLPTIIRHDSQKNTSLIKTQSQTPDSSPNIPAIVLPILLVLVVTSGGAVCFKFRKRIKTFGFRKENESLDINNSSQLEEPPVIFRKNVDKFKPEEKTEEYKDAQSNDEVYNSGSTLSYSYADDGASDIPRRVSIRAPPTSDD